MNQEDDINLMIEDNDLQSKQSNNPKNGEDNNGNYDDDDDNDDDDVDNEVEIVEEISKKKKKSVIKKSSSSSSSSSNETKKKRYRNGDDNKKEAILKSYIEDNDDEETKREIKANLELLYNRKTNNSDNYNDNNNGSDYDDNTDANDNHEEAKSEKSQSPSLQNNLINVPFNNDSRFSFYLKNQLKVGFVQFLKSIQSNSSVMEQLKTVPHFYAFLTEMDVLTSLLNDDGSVTEPKKKEIIKKLDIQRSADYLLMSIDKDITNHLKVKLNELIDINDVKTVKKSDLLLVLASKPNLISNFMINCCYNQ